MVKQNGDQDEIDVELENYVLLSPDNIPLDDKDKEKLQQVLERDPLSLIEYWSIDPDRIWRTTTTRCIVSIRLGSEFPISLRERCASRL